MVDDIEFKINDIFSQEDISVVKAQLIELVKRFGIHTHDGRNSLEIDIRSNQKKLILATLNQISDKSDGNVTISGTTTLTRDMFYDHLTIENGGILQPASFRIFADIIEHKAGAIIRNNGNTGGNGGNGANGSGATGGAGGSAGVAASDIVSGSLPGTVASVAGGAGGAGGSPSTNGSVGSTGTSAAKSLGGTGGGGVGGGNGGVGKNDAGGAYDNGASGGAGGSGGSQTGTVFNVPRSFISAYQLFDTQPSSTFAAHTISAGSGGSGGGGGGGVGGSG